VPYGARSTWHVFSGEREKTQRERLLELLGKHNAFVLSGHIHKYNLVVRTTPGGGRFLQIGTSSVVSTSDPRPRHNLLGIAHYNPEQVTVEPGFSPVTEKQRRAVYETERNFVKQFQYADLPGYTLVKIAGSRVVLDIYSGATRTVWRSLELTDLLAG
jgi:hypothetical protein